MKIPRRVRGYGYQTFYRLPGRVRRRLVRLVVPKYLVGAVTIVTDSAAAAPGRLLLLRQPPGRGWGLPAGLLKRHEPPAVGAARELFEESGVRLDAAALVPATPNALVHGQGWVDMVFRASVPADRTRLEVDGGEVLEARWWPLDELPRLTTATELLLGVYGIGPAAGSPQARRAAGAAATPGTSTPGTPDAPAPGTSTPGIPTPGAPTPGAPTPDVSVPDSTEEGPRA